MREAKDKEPLYIYALQDNVGYVQQKYPRIRITLRSSKGTKAIQFEHKRSPGRNNK